MQVECVATVVVKKKLPYGSRKKNFPTGVQFSQGGLDKVLTRRVPEE